MAADMMNAKLNAFAKRVKKIEKRKSRPVGGWAQAQYCVPSLVSSWRCHHRLASRDRFGVVLRAAVERLVIFHLRGSELQVQLTRAALRVFRPIR